MPEYRVCRSVPVEKERCSEGLLRLFKTYRLPTKLRSVEGWLIIVLSVGEWWSVVGFDHDSGWLFFWDWRYLYQDRMAKSFLVSFARRTQKYKFCAEETYSSEEKVDEIRDIWVEYLLKHENEADEENKDDGMKLLNEL